MRQSVDYTLYLVTDRALAGARALEWIVREAVEGGATIVQLREKVLSTRAFLEQALAVKRAIRGTGVPLIINDRLDIALACGADGAHLGQEDMPCNIARGIAGPDMIIGVSANTVEEAMRAEAEGADYVGVSPVFQTPTKNDAPSPAGLEGLRAIRRAVRIPLVGIGGVNMSNASAVIRAGADGVAVVSAIVAAPEPRAAALALRAAIADAFSSGPTRS